MSFARAVQDERNFSRAAETKIIDCQQIVKDSLRRWHDRKRYAIMPPET